MQKTTVTIDLKKIKYNYLYLKSLSKNSQTFAVVKTNAYGLGVIKITSYLKNVVDGFAVTTINEALELRENNITTKILLLIGIFSTDELRVAIKYNFIITISTIEQAKIVLNYQLKNDIDIFLKFDSGMSRLGLDFDEYLKIYQKLKVKQGIKEIVLMSHFCCIDENNHLLTLKQIKNINILKTILKINKTSVSNSAGILTQIYQQDFNRTGISLYGVNTTNINSNLQAAIELTAPIITIKNIKNENSIGYGATFECKKNMKIAVVKIGYGDGYPRNIDKNTPVFVAGKKTIIVGRISMDMLTIDLTNISAKVGDMVELFGYNVDINIIAKSANTIAYEIFCNLASRVERKYI